MSPTSYQAAPPRDTETRKQKGKISEHPPFALPAKFLVETTGFEPATSCLQSRRSSN